MKKNATIIDNSARLVFSGHETFPMRYGWLKKSIDAAEKLGFGSKDYELITVE